MAKNSKTIDKLKGTIANLRKRARGVREDKTTGLIARSIGAAGTAAAAGGSLDAAINLLPGGHFGHADYTKGPSAFAYKRTVVAALATAASVYFLDGVEGDVVSPTLAALTGRALAQHRATYYKKTAARTPEELAKDIGAEQAAKVAAANGYPQV